MSTAAPVDFNVDVDRLQNAKRASVAAEPLAAWVKANLAYSAILEKIAPLENEKEKILK